jgi:hypothetical protein
MDLFNLIFISCMLLTPMFFMQFYKPREGDEVDRARVRKLGRRLNLATTLALVSFLTLFMIHFEGSTGTWEDHPRLVGFADVAYKLAWLAFFPLWFGLGMPLMMACRPEARSAFVDSRGQTRQARSASLTPRGTSSNTPDHVHSWMLALWFVGAALTVFFAWSRHAELVASNPQYWLTAALGLPLALSIPALHPSVRRSLALEPEPLDISAASDLDQAYASLRSAKARGLLALELIMELLLLTTSVLSVSVHMDGSVTGIAGAVVGITVGLAGAIFGTVMSNRRMHIQRMLNDLAES